MSFRYAGLFAGIGGLEIAAEMCGGEPVFMCEQDEFCQRVLRRRFPGVPIIGDVHDVNPAEWVGKVDGLVGGFPCQGISAAGRGLGLADPRSGLWSEQFRIIVGLRPKIALIENVPLLRTRGLSKVLQDLDSIGYHAEWDIISAAAVGALHLRERIWIIARPAEIAQTGVYGCPTGKPFGFHGKLPRAGRMGETLDELEPLAPRKTKRDGSWSYWSGVNLMGTVQVASLWRTPNFHDGSNRKAIDPRQRQAEGRQVSLTDQVDAVMKGTILLPTPAASSYGNNQGGGAGRVGPVRHSLQSMAKNNLWPTPTATDSRGSRNLTARRPGGNGLHHGGTTLTDALILSGDMAMPPGGLLPTPKATDADQGVRGDLIQVVRGNTSPSGHYGQSLFPTPTARDHKDTGDLSRVPEKSLLPRVVQRAEREGNTHLWPSPTASDGMGGPGTSPRRTGGENLRTAVSGPKKGSLNPTWVEWLMGLPLWWTDPTVHTAFVTHVGWDAEPLHVAPRTSTEINLRIQRLKACGNAVVWPCAYFALSRALESTPQISAQATLQAA